MPHSPAAGILSTASLHAYATVTAAHEPHEYSTEYGPPPDQIAALFVEPIEPKAGRIRIPDRPGLGLVLNDAVVDPLRIDEPTA
jgi:L-alanine-DL-glutamate epimerase-like enolase superfamily enzyme